MSFPEVFTWIFDIWLSAIKYIVEIRDSSDNLVCILENAHSIKYIEAINVAPTLSFSLPADDDKADYILKANEIWLRNYEPESPTLVNRFRLAKRYDRRESGGEIITMVEADGLINQLADEQLVAAYSAAALTPEAIATALIALQVLTPAITIGTIAPTSTRTIEGNIGETILKVLYRLRDTVGGYLYVDNDRALQWADSIGADTGQQIRYQKNLVGVTREIDYTTIGNRIYAYGAGSGDARVKLSDATGSPPDYVEDTDSQTDWGGIFVKVLINQSITDADALLAWATLQLADLHDPIITYRLDTTDLAEATEGGFGFEPLTLGSTIKFIDEDLDIDLDVHVVKITHPDLLHPEQVQIEVTNLTSSTPTIRTKDIIDVISDFQLTQWEYEITPFGDIAIGDGEAIIIRDGGDIELEGDATVVGLSAAIVFIIDGGGAAITTGEKGHISMPFAGEIISSELVADQSGSIVIDIWEDTYANFPPTDDDSITASAPPTLSSGQKSQDTTLTGWTTTFSEGDILAFNVDSASTVTRVTLTLKVVRT